MAQRKQNLTQQLNDINSEIQTMLSSVPTKELVSSDNTTNLVTIIKVGFQSVTKKLSGELQILEDEIDEELSQEVSHGDYQNMCKQLKENKLRINRHR